MKLHLFRHGETDWNKQGLIQGQTDIPLNATGISQAKELAQRLADENIQVKVMYTSPYKRAKETAGMIAGRLGIDCIVKEGLREIGFGKWEGITWDQVKLDYPREYDFWQKNRRYQAPPEGESYQELLVRVVDDLREIIVDNTEDVAVIAHSAVIMTLQSWLYDTEFHEMIKKYKTQNTAGITIEGSVILKKNL